MAIDTDTIALARELVSRPSVTPDDAGCQALLAGLLEKSGFSTESMRFGEVDNLWARRGQGQPMLVFAGHTDVVPPGPETAWRVPPYSARIEGGMLKGRGAADMKGSLAAMALHLVPAVLLGLAGPAALLVDLDPPGQLLNALGLIPRQPD